jgi:hypothetical protein
MLQQLGRCGSIGQIPQALRQEILERRRKAFERLGAENATGLGCSTTGLLAVHS